MGYNTRQLKASPDPKAPAKPKDVIVDPKGQWKHPGKVTKIPGDTMATHGYGDIPLWVVPDVGPPRMVQPNTGIQVFPGANSFTEYPMHKVPDGSMMRNDKMQDGGWLDTMQDGGFRTDVYTDKALFDKAYKAEQDSLHAYNLTYHNPNYDDTNEYRIFANDLSYTPSKLDESWANKKNTEDRMHNVYESKDQPKLDSYESARLNIFLKNTSLKPEHYKTLETDHWYASDFFAVDKKSGRATAPNTSVIENDIDINSLKKRFPKVTQAFIDSTYNNEIKTPGYYKGNLKLEGQGDWADEPKKGYYKQESKGYATRKDVTSIPYWKKPVVHNVYQPTPPTPPSDTTRHWNFNGANPVMEYYKGDKIVKKDYYDKTGKKINPYIPEYTTPVSKDKLVTKQEGGATSLRAVPTYASEKEQNKYTPYQRMVLQARANNQADREYNTVTGFVNLASHVPGPSQLLFSGLSSAVDFTEDNYAKSLLGLVPYKPFKIADAAGDVKDIYEQKKGGSVKGLSKFTSKNIKTSVNKLQMRNETLFGERGRKIYHPDAKGWLDNYK